MEIMYMMVVWIRQLVAEKWNEIVLTACVVSVAIDPLFMYIPVIDEQRQCLDMDNTLKIVACCLRTLIDLIHVIHIIWMHRTDRFYSSRLHLVNDVLSVLPLPQIAVILVGIVAPISKDPTPEATKQLMIVILVQYVPRLIRIFPIYKEASETSRIINTQRAWAGAALNLFLYFIASHVVGAFWYQFAIDREVRCWHHQCWKLLGDDNCKLENLYCRESSRSIPIITFPACIVKNPDAIDDQNHYFNYGIFYPALSDVANSTNFPLKLLYCFWWALRSLSSLGQNLQTGPSSSEILFSIFICVFGLILFALLIGNMQKCLETITIKVEEMKAGRQHAEQTEQWMSQWSVSDDLRASIRKYEQHKWKETRGVDVETLMRNLPKDLRVKVKRNICLPLLKRVPLFSWMGSQTLDAICELMTYVLYTDNMSIVIDGHPIEEMLFIKKGRVTCTNEKAHYMTEGDFVGEELISWALIRNSSFSNLPISERNVTTISDVQAFSLLADDLRRVLMRFCSKKEQSRKLRRTFRFYSPPWRTWASIYIQAAWRRHCRKKLGITLRETGGDG